MLSLARTHILLVPWLIFPSYPPAVCCVTHMPSLTKFESNPPKARTFARQHELPKLPVPPLEDTLKRYLRALEGLQDEYEHEETKIAVHAFLHEEGPDLQERLKVWAQGKARQVSHYPTS